jgi:hypothetical protein
MPIIQKMACARKQHPVPESQGAFKSFNVAPKPQQRKSKTAVFWSFQFFDIRQVMSTDCHF